jgi:hypothetical protein
VIAYVQRSCGEWINGNAFAAQDGFRQLGVEVRGFEALEDLTLDGDVIVHGYVGVVRRAIELIGATPPFVPDLPESLTAFRGRKVERTTLGAVRKGEEPVFVKPYREHKAFTGYVRGRDLHDLSRSAHLDDEFEVLASEAVRFVSEWRCFVLSGRCIGVRPYVQTHLDPMPDLRLVDPIIEAFVEAPIAYSVDLGRLDDGRTVLVEINDAYSLGCYGLPSVPYAQMIEARFREIVGSRDR